MSAKFANDSYLLVREIGRGRGVQEVCSLEIAENVAGLWKEAIKTGSRFANILEKGSRMFISPIANQADATICGTNQTYPSERPSRAYDFLEIRKPYKLLI